MSNLYIFVDQFFITGLPNVKLGGYSSLREQSFRSTSRSIKVAVADRKPEEVTFVVTKDQGHLLRSSSSFVTVLVRYFGFEEQSFIDNDKYNIVSIDFPNNKVEFKPGDEIFSLIIRNAYSLLSVDENIIVTPDNIFSIKHWKVYSEALPKWARDKLPRVDGNAYRKDTVVKLDDDAFVTVITKTRAVKVNYWDEEPFCHDEVILITRNDRNKVIFKTSEYNIFEGYPEESVVRLHLSRSGKSLVVTTEDFDEIFDEEVDYWVQCNSINLHPILLSEILK